MYEVHNNRTAYDNFGTFLPMIVPHATYLVKKVDCQEELLAMLEAGCHVDGMTINLTVSHHDEGWGDQLFKMPVLLHSQKPWVTENPKWTKMPRWELQGKVHDHFLGTYVFAVLFAKNQCFTKDVTIHPPGLSGIVHQIIHDDNEAPSDN